jgi:hypothetical protein
MPVKTSWYIENRVTLQVMSGVLTGADLIESRRQVDTLAVQANVGPVHSLGDLTTVQNFPIDLRAMRDAYGGKRPSNLGWIVIIGTNPLFPTIIAALSQLIRVKL